MKKLTFFTLLSLLFSSVLLNAQTSLWSEDFDNNTQYTVTLGGEGNDGPNDYFQRTDGSNIGITYTGKTGANFFAGQDIDDGGWPGSASPSQLTWASFSISSYTNLEFKGYFASAATNKIDNNDYLHVEFRIDGGTWTNLIWFENDGATYNTYFLEDTDFDGTGDGTQLTSTFAQFTKSITGTGSTLELRFTAAVNAGGEDFAIDYFEVTGIAPGGVNNPSNLTAVTADTGQIDLSWSQNAAGDDVMLAYTADGIFGTPVDGTTYEAGDTIPGGGEVIYNGSDTSYSHTGLTADTRYFYKAWSVDATPNYSSGTTADTTTLAAEPTADPTAFTASTNSASEITLDWTDAVPASESYLVKGSSLSYADIVDPVDGVQEDDSALVHNVPAATQTTQFTGLAPNTTYYFQIYPYNGDNGSVNFKTDNPQQASSTTDNANTDLIISEVADPGDNYQSRFVELYNLGITTIDFGTDIWYLVKQSNGSSYSRVQLADSVVSGGVYVVAYSDANFNSSYGFYPDLASGIISGNGDDGYFLYYGGDETSGTLIDAYGVMDQDGSGEDWEYLDAKAVRLRSVTAPNTTWTAAEWDIPASANVDDMTPAECREDVTWQGTTDTDWNTKGNNWSGTNGYIPDASFNVTVPSSLNEPVVSAESACNDLTLQSGTGLSVSVNTSLTAYGDLDVAFSKASRAAANFTIQSDATGNGSFIGKGMMFGDVTVERYIAAYSNANDGWHEIASPIDMMTIAGSDFEPGTNDDLYEWIEQTETWHNYKSPGSFTEFYGGQGYLVAYQTTATKQFTGELTNLDFDFTNLPYTPSKGDGWNLMGNPYPSAILWDATSPDWALVNIGGVAQVWDEAAGNYSLINNGDAIPSTNGFFVQAADATNSMTIPASARVHHTQNNYKSSSDAEKSEVLLIKVTNDENTFYDLSRVGFKAEATEAWDMAFDARKLSGAATAPKIWTVSNGEKFAQNYLPYVYETFALPLHFKAGTNTIHHLTFSGLENFSPNSEIYLEDTFLQTIIDLREQQLYDFTASVSDAESRFILHFYGVTTIGEKPAGNTTTVFANQNTVYIKFDQIPKSTTRVEVFNVTGQLVYTTFLEPATLSSFSLYQKTGIYIVRLQTENGSVVQKVMIR